MKIKFFNLGKIREADFELADFTLIVGDNSLGKTVLLESYALYSNVMREKQADFCRQKYIYDLQIDTQKFVDECTEELTITYKTKGLDNLHALLNEYKEDYLHLLKSNILKNMDSDVSVEIDYNHIDLEKFPQQATILKNESMHLVRFKSEYFTDSLSIYSRNYEGLSQEMNSKILKRRIEYYLNKTYFEKLCGIEELIFLPSERNLYKTNAYRKSAEFIEDSFSQIEKDNEMRYSESLFVKSYFEYLDFLNVYEDFDISIAKDSLYQVLCNCLGGTPNYQDGVVNSIQQNDALIPQTLFSTKQNRLIPYLMLCTPISIAKDRIIIEEPEAHMSLKSMFELVEMTEHILKLNKLVLTSHSDIFVSLLNVLIKQRQIKSKVYELLDENGHSVLKEVIPGNYGYELSFMSEQIIRLNNEIALAFKDVMEEEDRRATEEFKDAIEEDGNLQD